MQAPIDLEKILKHHGNFHGVAKVDIIHAMKQAIRESLPVILKEVSEKAELNGNADDSGYVTYEVDKESIISQEQELIKLLNI